MKIEFTPDGGVGDLNCIVDGKVRFAVWGKPEDWRVQDIQEGGEPVRCGRRDEEALKNLLTALVIGSTERAVEYAGRDKIEFAIWLGAVDRTVRRLTEFSVFDLPDADFHPWFEERRKPLDVAQDVIQDTVMG